jgi:hypothetical protein
MKGCGGQWLGTKKGWRVKSEKARFALANQQTLLTYILFKQSTQ